MENKDLKFLISNYKDLPKYTNAHISQEMLHINSDRRGAYKYKIENSCRSAFWYAKDLEITLIINMATGGVWNYSYCNFKSDTFISCNQFVNNLVNLIKSKV